MKNNLIVFGSNNQKKINEIRGLVHLNQIENVTLVSLKEYLKDQPINIHDVSEYALSYSENAIIKAWQISQLIRENVLSDDSGIEIAALDDKPGVQSRRWKSYLSNKERNLYIIDKLQNNPKRSAKYVCALAFVNYQAQTIHLFNGVCHGKISTTIDEKPKRSFGYDPIFICDDTKKYYSKLTIEQKNKVSHRANAFLKFVSYIKNVI